MSSPSTWPLSGQTAVDECPRTPDGQWMRHTAMPHLLRQTSGDLALGMSTKLPSPPQRPTPSRSAPSAFNIIHLCSSPKEQWKPRPRHQPCPQPGCNPEGELYNRTGTSPKPGKPLLTAALGTYAQKGNFPHYPFLSTFAPLQHLVSQKRKGAGAGP